MFEDNQQWDESEYSEDTEYEYSDEDEYEEEMNGEYEDEEYSDEDEEYEDGEYSDDEDEEYSDEDEEYEDGEEYEYEDEPKKNNSALIIVIVIIILLLLVGVGCFLMFGNGGSKSDKISDSGMVQNTETSSMFEQNDSSNNSESIDISFDDNGNINVEDGNAENGDVIKVSDIPLAPAQDGVNVSQSSEEFVNENLPANDVKKAEENPETNDSIMVSYTKAGNPNPFKPPFREKYVEKSNYSPYAIVDNNRYEVFEPPVAVVQDVNLVRLLNTEISGIMYDSTSPSAIIKLNNIDYYVKPGDKISGYTIGRITKDSVQVTYKNNSYVASVGELFSRESVNRHDVANIENKFGGRYKNEN